MDESQFEGTLVLEKLAEIGKVDDFFEAVDDHNLKRARLLMEQAGVDAASIDIVLHKMEEGDEDH